MAARNGAPDLESPDCLTWVEGLIESIGTHLSRVDIKSLPCVRIESPDVWEALPIRTPAIYFLVSDNLSEPLRWRPQKYRRIRRNGLLYIGKAVDLRQRWNNNSFMAPGHEMLEKSIAVGDVSMHWLAVKRQHTAIIESVLIQRYKPPWNTCLY